MSGDRLPTEMTPVGRASRTLTLLLYTVVCVCVCVQLVEFCQDATDMGKVVIVAALDATFEKKVRAGWTDDGLGMTGILIVLACLGWWQPFVSVCALVPMAEKVEKLNAVCVICGRDAGGSIRLMCGAIAWPI